MTTPLDIRPEAQAAAGMSRQSPAHVPDVGIGIGEAQRQAVVAILNTVLADEFVPCSTSRAGVFTGTWRDPTSWSSTICSRSTTSS